MHSQVNLCFFFLKAGKFESNTTSNWLNCTVKPIRGYFTFKCSLDKKKKKIWRTRLRTFSTTLDTESTDYTFSFTCRSIWEERINF